MRLYFFIFLLVSLSTQKSLGQNYVWNDYVSGNYIVDYEANNKKLIEANSGFITHDFVIDTITQQLMILTNDGVVVRDLDGTFDRFIPIDYFGDERKIQIDPIRRKIYFIANVRIYSVNYDGSSLTELYREDAEYIDDLAIDFKRGKMYWRTGYSKEEVKGANIDGTDVKTIFIGDVRDVEFDGIENVLYYRDLEDRRIEKLDLNTNFTTAIYDFTNNADYVAEIFLDEENQWLYFQNGAPYRSFRLDLVSGDSEEIYNFEQRIDVLKPYNNQLFVNVDSYKENRIVSLDLTTNEADVIWKREEYLRVFQIDEENERWIGTTHFGSLRSTDMFGNLIHEHLPKGIQTIIDIEVVGDTYIFLDGRRLYSTNSQFENLKLLTTLEELSPQAITYNPNDQKIYIVSRWRGSMYRCDLDGSNYEKFIELAPEVYYDFAFTDIIFSGHNNKFYLTGNEDILLVQMDEDGSNLVSLETGDFNDDLYYLTLDPSGEYLYYLSREEEKIYQLNVSTKEKQTIASNIPESIVNLFFHPTDGFLYAVGGSEKSIYKFENGEAIVVYEVDSDFSLGSAFTISSEGTFLLSHRLDYKAISQIDPSLTTLSTHLDRNYRFGQKLVYNEDENELWGIVSPSFSNPKGRPFKLNLGTDQMTYYPEVGNNYETLIIPEHNMVYWVEEYDKRSILRNNLITGAIDTILFIEENFKRYSNLIYNPVNERIYYGRKDDGLRLQSTDVFGNDHRIENYNYSMTTMVAVNPADSTITMLENYGDDKIHRWNFVTEEIVSFGEEKDKEFKLSWNLTKGYYDSIDEDGDGFSFLEDCDDSMASINPDAVEIPDNYIDENCDGIVEFTDEDGDGVPINYDCNDQDSTVNLFATEIPNNDVDENCDGIIEVIDLDGDGFNGDVDCDDFNADINPNAVEIPDNYIDENCDGILEGTDVDGDGYFISDDCDDMNSDIHPGQVEDPYNGLDDDCNPETLDDDLDQDGFLLIDDCDDTNASIHPDQMEEPYNGLDDDCDSETLDDDLDQDGFLLADDCDDTNSDINPDAEDIPNNGIDENCDGLDLIISTNELSNVIVSIYPNPASDLIHIKIDGVLRYNLTIYNSVGKRILTKRNVSQLSVQSLPAGTYNLEIQDIQSGKKLVEKVIVMK